MANFQGGWGPGEFEEWKNAHITGAPTQYGLEAQRRYMMSKVPGSGVFDQPLQALQTAYRPSRPGMFDQQPSTLFAPGQQSAVTGLDFEEQEPNSLLPGGPALNALRRYR